MGIRLGANRRLDDQRLGLHLDDLRLDHLDVDLDLGVLHLDLLDVDLGLDEVAFHREFHLHVGRDRCGPFQNLKFQMDCFRFAGRDPCQNLKFQMDYCQDADPSDAVALNLGLMQVELKVYLELAAH